MPGTPFASTLGRESLQGNKPLDEPFRAFLLALMVGLS